MHRGGHASGFGGWMKYVLFEGIRFYIQAIVIAGVDIN